MEIKRKNYILHGLTALSLIAAIVLFFSGMGAEGFLAVLAAVLFWAGGNA